MDILLPSPAVDDLFSCKTFPNSHLIEFLLGIPLPFQDLIESVASLVQLISISASICLNQKVDIRCHGSLLGFYSLKSLFHTLISRTSHFHLFLTSTYRVSQNKVTNGMLGLM